MIKRIVNDDEHYIVNNRKKVFHVDINNINNSYTVDIKFSKNTVYRSNILGIIDSGSGNTIITLSALFNNVSDNLINILSYTCRSVNAYTCKFSSVKGIQDIECIYCTLPEITINGFNIKNFPFYLSGDTTRSLALIGYDFISSCDVVQPKNQGMTFYNFDYKSMLSKFKGRQALNLLNLSKF